MRYNYILLLVHNNIDTLWRIVMYSKLVFFQIRVLGNVKKYIFSLI